MALTEILNAELVEKELIAVTLYSVDVGLGIRRNLNDLDDVVITSVQNDEVIAYDSTTKTWKNKSVAETELTKLVFNEVPIQVAGAIYRVANKYVSGTMRVYLRGLKIYATQITYDPNNKKFTLDFIPEVSDLIEVSYVKQ